jgi:hypothetical protein
MDDLPAGPWRHRDSALQGVRREEREDHGRGESGEEESQAEVATEPPGLRDLDASEREVLDPIDAVDEHLIFGEHATNEGFKLADRGLVQLWSKAP